MQRVLIPFDISSDRPIDGHLHDFHGETMGTTWSVRLVGLTALTALTDAGCFDLQSGIQHTLDAVVSEMSHWLPESDLCRFNRAEAGRWHILPPAFFNVLACALAVAADSNGAYDPACGALIDLWGFGPARRYNEAGFILPDRKTVQSLAARADWRRIRLDRQAHLALQPGGAMLDFSSIAKGFAVDQVARYLESQGIQHYLVEVGGELRGAGMKPDGQPWWVALEQPGESSDVLLALHGLSVATSGDYRRYFEWEGRWYSHTLDTRTGYPIDNGIASVTVLHAECMIADALSTALMVMSVEHGLPFAEARGLAVRFLVREGHRFERLVEHASSSFMKMLQ